MFEIRSRDRSSPEIDGREILDLERMKIDFFLYYTPRSFALSIKLILSKRVIITIAGYFFVDSASFPIPRLSSCLVIDDASFRWYSKPWCASSAEKNLINIKREYRATDWNINEGNGYAWRNEDYSHGTLVNSCLQ